MKNTYTTALMAYVFTLAGDVETRALLLQHLDKVAEKKGESLSRAKGNSRPLPAEIPDPVFVGGLLHWTQKSTETSASLSVEISSYVILAKLSSSPTAEELAYASRIVRWLTGQQNHYGGFSSTQVRPRQLDSREQAGAQMDYFSVIISDVPR